MDHDRGRRSGFALRGEVPREDMEAALHDLDAIGDKVREALKGALQRHGKG
jgi:hypothetical protein